MKPIKMDATARTPAVAFDAATASRSSGP